MIKGSSAAETKVNEWMAATRPAMKSFEEGIAWEGKTRKKKTIGNVTALGAGFFCTGI